MACKKVCKQLQGRDDITAEVNLQIKPYPYSCRDEAFVHSLSLLYHPFLVCILFGMPSLHLFTKQFYFLLASMLIYMLICLMRNYKYATNSGNLLTGRSNGYVGNSRSLSFFVCCDVLPLYLCYN